MFKVPRSAHPPHAPPRRNDRRSIPHSYSPAAERFISIDVMLEEVIKSIFITDVSATGRSALSELFIHDYAINRQDKTLKTICSCPGPSGDVLARSCRGTVILNNVIANIHRSRRANNFVQNKSDSSVYGSSRLNQFECLAMHERQSCVVHRPPTQITF